MGLTGSRKASWKVLLKRACERRGGRWEQEKLMSGASKEQSRAWLLS
jgi:hypothetical protein